MTHAKFNEQQQKAIFDDISIYHWSKTKKSILVVFVKRTTKEKFNSIKSSLKSFSLVKISITADYTPQQQQRNYEREQLFFKLRNSKEVTELKRVGHYELSYKDKQGTIIRYPSASSQTPSTTSNRTNFGTKRQHQ
jgi:hypothetical protein